MYQDGFVASSNLNFNDVIGDIGDCLDTGAAAVRSPVGDVKLVHLLHLIGL